MLEWNAVGRYSVEQELLANDNNIMENHGRFYQDICSMVRRHLPSKDIIVSDEIARLQAQLEDRDRACPCGVSFCATDGHSAPNPADSLGIHVFNCTCKSNEVGICGVCLVEVYRVHTNRPGVYTPCKHLFCRPCIDRWLKQDVGKTCPSCRAIISQPPRR